MSYRTVAGFVLALAVLTAGRAAAVDEAEIMRLRDRMENITREAANGVIAEQSGRQAKADAALMVATMFESGRFEGRRLALALEFYELAADFGSAEANCALGMFYYNGIDSPEGQLARDPKKAMDFLHKAAAGGSVPAMVHLGVIYADGMGVDPDAAKALPFFVDAAARGDEAALRRLEPVMRQAREWEEARPGRKANFPTSRDDLIKPELVKEYDQRLENLDRIASRHYVEINKRVAAAVKADIPAFPTVQ
ncbi:MAG: sel1 repeat family protein [Planctomycetes bacterium]|nr:sel1 repeat family protein [Planctomycetota bacterium]